MDIKKENHHPRKKKLNKDSENCLFCEDSLLNNQNDLENIQQKEGEKRQERQLQLVTKEVDSCLNIKEEQIQRQSKHKVNEGNSIEQDLSYCVCEENKGQTLTSSQDIDLKGKSRSEAFPSEGIQDFSSIKEKEKINESNQFQQDQETQKEKVEKLKNVIIIVIGSQKDSRLIKKFINESDLRLSQKIQACKVYRNQFIQLIEFPLIQHFEKVGLEKVLEVLNCRDHALKFIFDNINEKDQESCKVINKIVRNYGPEISKSSLIFTSRQKESKADQIEHKKSQKDQEIDEKLKLQKNLPNIQQINQGLKQEIEKKLSILNQFLMQKDNFFNLSKFK